MYREFFPRKFNSEQFLLEAFFDIIGTRVGKGKTADLGFARVDPEQIKRGEAE